MGTDDKGNEYYENNDYFLGRLVGGRGGGGGGGIIRGGGAVSCFISGGGGGGQFVVWKRLFLNIHLFILQMCIESTSLSQFTNGYQQEQVDPVQRTKLVDSEE